MRWMSKTRALFFNVPLDSDGKNYNLSHICRMSESLLISEAARRAGIDRRTLQRWHRQGLIVLDDKGRVTMENVQTAISRPKKAGRPAGQRTERLDVLRRRAVEATHQYLDELVKKVPADKRAKARMMMTEGITGEPMNPCEAESFIEYHYLAPIRQEKEWAALIPQIRQKMPKAQVVEWEKRDQFVREEGIPQGPYVHTKEHIDAKLLCDAGKPMTWGKLAMELGAPVFVAPAPKSNNGYLVLVCRSTVVDGDSTRDETVLRNRKRKADSTRRA